SLHVALPIWDLFLFQCTLYLASCRGINGHCMCRVGPVELLADALLTFPLLSLTRQSIGLARLVLDDPRLLGLSLLGQLVLGGGFRLPGFLSGGLGKILGFARGPFATQHSKAPGLLDLIYRLIRHQ